MSDPRCSQGSGGDYFLGLRYALLTSLALHGVVLVFIGQQPQQLGSDGGVRLQAVIGKPGYSTSVMRQGVQGIDLASKTPALRQAMPGPSVSLGVPARVDASRPTPSPDDVTEYSVAEGMDLSAYRLAVGRAFANLLDEQLREALPAGELIFRVNYSARGGEASLQLTAPSAEAYAEQLLAMMTQAVSLSPLPEAWLTGDYNYSIELRAEVGGR